MKSIRARFLTLNLLSVFLCTLLIGGLGLWSISTLHDKDYQEILVTMAKSESQDLNDSIDSIKASVDLFVALTDDLLPSISMLESEEFLDRFCQEAEKSMGKISAVTQGVCAYYFRIAPEFTPKPGGFFYGKRPGFDAIVKETLTDLSIYDPSDIEHVGWYYLPRQAGHAIWMEPYYNKNLDVYMVSYVVPLYRDGVFWGLAGMDIDFNVVIEQVRSIHPYETSYAFLANEEGRIFYHPETKIGESIGDLSEEIDTLLKHIKAGEATDPCLRYHYLGKEKTLSYHRLHNDMLLMLTVNDQEIARPAKDLLKAVLAMALLVLAVMASLVVFYANRIIRPLEQLTQAAQQISQGNLEVALPDHDESEVGVLTKSFKVTVSSLKKHIAQINSIALTDALTHVKNKTAYAAALDNLQQDIDQGKAAFAILMCDLNDLKHVNDVYGHERGDEYLVHSCKLICNVFQHSPVFRIGGDEFVVILKGTDLADNRFLLKKLNEAIHASMLETEAWKQLKIAKGIAFWKQGDANVADVFHRADQAMYADKKRMKEALPSQ